MNDQLWYDTHRLVHYTKTPQVVSAILRAGFLLVPNRRDLIQRLIRTREFISREPQQFGMVSFTELRVEDATGHRETFGEYGIVMSWEWVIEHAAQRVMYIGEGSVLQTFSWLFEFATQELERNSGDKAPQFAGFSKVAAGAYSQLYMHLLTLYEFMEPERNSSQVEWRIVNTLPHSVDLSDREAMMRKLIAEASTWNTGTVKVEAEDIVMIVAPLKHIEELRGQIPASFRGVPIVPYTRRSPVEVLSSWASRARAKYRGRARYSANTSNSVSAKPRAEEGVSNIREVTGISLTPDQVVERACFNVAYHADDPSAYLNLKIPFVEAVKLLGFLQQAMSEPSGRALFEIALKRIAYDENARNK
jgi:hypothetical protein